MPTEPARQKICPTCGVAFRCGPGSAADGSGCWCESLPALKPAAGIDCLCPACLDKAVAVQTEATVIRPT